MKTNKYNRSQIMSRAWAIRKTDGVTMSAALKAAWSLAKQGYTMTAAELVERYGIRDAGNHKVAVSNTFNAQKDGAEKVMAELKARKPEILDYFQDQRKAAQRAWEEREAKINAIPGLTELKAAYAARAEYRNRFNLSFDGEYAVGGMGIGPRPTTDIDALRIQYPAAAAFLLAEDKANSTNFKIAGIGRDAMDAIIANPADYAAAMETANNAMRAYAGVCMWD